MIGDPTGTGSGGNSFWGEPFKDEFNQHLTHSGRGIVSMANSGPSTNKSSFFITYRSAKHLDKKHTVFGKVVGGIECLDKMEKIETDAKDRPKSTITIEKVVVYVDPFKEIDDIIQAERDKAIQASSATESKAKGKDAADVAPKQFRKGVGSFIDLSTLSSQTEITNESDQRRPSSSSSIALQEKKSKKKVSSLGNFSSW